MSRSPHERVADITEAIHKIRSSVDLLANTSDEAIASAAYDATIYRLQIIGEAAVAIPQDVLAAVPEVPWQNIKGLRNVLVHHYHRVDDAIIAATCGDPLDQLEAALPDVTAAINAIAEPSAPETIVATRSEQ